LKRKDDAELFTSSIIRVFGGEEIMGVGFCVDPTRMLTCAHVVEQALNTQDPPLDSEVQIDAPRLALAGSNAQTPGRDCILTSPFTFSQRPGRSPG